MTQSKFMPVFLYKKPSPGEATGSRRFGLIASTGSVDSDRDRVNPAGWDLTRYRANPVVLVAHDYSRLPVARVVDPRVEAGELVGTLEFPPPGISRTADEAHNLVASGLLRGVSVGFKPIGRPQPNDVGGLDYAGAQLMDISLVPVSSNAEALVLGTTKATKPAAHAALAAVVTRSPIANDGQDPTRDTAAVNRCPYGARGCPKRAGQPCDLAESCPLALGAPVPRGLSDVQRRTRAWLAESFAKDRIERAARQRQARQ